MDRSRFDQLTRDFAASPSRRLLVKSALGLALGGTLGAVGLNDVSAVQAGRAPAEICRKNGDCASGHCGPTDRTGRRRCLCTSAEQCPPSKDIEFEAVCSPEGLCGFQESGGCFIAGTQIAIPGGASRAIEFFMPGDEVIGSTGTINRVIELERHQLGRNRLLYSINESGFMFSAEHVFLSDTCWRAINVDIARRDDPTSHIEPLRVGDVLYTMVQAPVVATVGAGYTLPGNVAEPFVVTSLIGSWAPPETEIFNILLDHDGDYTYFANGLLVSD